MVNSAETYAAAADRAAAYGVHDNAPMSAEIAAVRDKIDHSNPVRLSNPALVKITRLRLLGDPGPYSFPYFDLSYCYGELADGTPVKVQLPQWQFPKRGVRGHIVQMFKDSGRHAKNMGALDALNICM